ncbi:unnamed protein product [Rotaria sp. Silwood1]|nr:unnamed protein product [Rotaria sp. Silwood1]CAF1580637.1 unnamed protein product [Rotaria sp. Silwood1]CAF3643465.1 unnamed protein product [Rotaria sp. Silwood1]CAF4788386.1 unnamed protein product [Rotaria sp. Silwood1]
MRGVLLLGFFVVLTTSNVSHSQPDIESDTWVAIAGLDRALSNITQVGPPRANRTVGIFYFLTLCNDGILSGPYDISKILKASMVVNGGVDAIIFYASNAVTY